MRFLTALNALLFFSLIVSVPASAMDFKTGESVEVEGEYSDNLFVSGGQIHAELKSTDDVFMAAGKINFEGDAAGSLWMAGGDVSVRDLTSHYGVFAGGNVLLVNSSLQELIMAAGSVRLQKIEVQDDLLVAGGQIYLDEDSSVKGSATIMGGEVTLAGHFSGEVRVAAEKLKLAPSLVIEGNLIHKTTSLEVSDGARIMGQTIATPVEKRDWVKGGLAIGFFGILFLIGSLLIIPILAILFPTVVEQGSAILRGHFWECLGKGIVAVIVLIFVWFLLLVSVIGTPIALVSIPFIMVAKVLAWTIATFTVATLIRGALSKTENAVMSRWARFGWTLLALVILIAVFFIPILGFLLALLLCFASFGALYLEIRHRYGNERLS